MPLIWPLILVILQLPLTRAILEAEDARSRNIEVYAEALQSDQTEARRLAIRALGRLERPELAHHIIPFLDAAEPSLRAEAVNSLGQMRADVELLSTFKTETAPAVRAVYYRTMARLPKADEVLLIKGLEEADPVVREGAAKGVETLYRLNARKGLKPPLHSLQAMRKAFRENSDPLLRRLLLLALNSVGDADPSVIEAAFGDSDPQVRRLAVIATKRWRDDPSPMVRYEALRLAPSCDRAAAALADPSPHVALLAVDLLGNGCPADILENIVDRSNDWRRQARALVSLSRVGPDSAAERLERFARHDRWQVRAYAAAAAKVLKNEQILKSLLEDKHAGVATAALEKPEDAVRMLRNPDYGLIMRAADCLKGWAEGRSAVPELMAALERITAERSDTSRDPRRAILERLAEFGGREIIDGIKPLLNDFDPVVAQLAAKIISEKGGEPVSAQPTHLSTRPVPPQSLIDSLRGAAVRIRMAEAGPFTMELLMDVAPVLASSFVQLAESGYYTNLTFHRIVPNFVIQGGSPGANEYVGTAGYFRDELGLVSHTRGTVGLSTRGRDTGDGQIFINLVDNFRLDHNYTVFARVVEGMENVDRIQEGDTIEAIDVIRRNNAPGKH